MSAKKEQFTTIVANKGRRVHAVSLVRPNHTACGRRFSGWKLTPARLNCGKCKLAILKTTMESKR